MNTTILGQEIFAPFGPSQGSHQILETTNATVSQQSQVLLRFN